MDKKKHLRPSVFDRLLDDEPHLNTEAQQNSHQQLQSLRDSVRRDLQNLLNTRHRIIMPQDEHKELEKSLLNYGLPDLATINIQDLEKRKVFTKTLEKILKEYEPRFKSVKVSYMEQNGNIDRTLRFRIDAVLYADPAPEVVVFDSTLEPVSRAVSVEEAYHV